MSNKQEHKKRVIVSSGLRTIDGLRVTYETKEIRAEILAIEGDFDLPEKFAVQVIPSGESGKVAKIIEVKKEAPATGQGMGEDENLMEWIAIFYGALKDLVDLKDYKDKVGKDHIYTERQPMVWHSAKQAIELWKKSDYGALPLKSTPQERSDKE